ncbi:uncharacterized protein LOC123302923 [Chrysoperla carnea]|uniref:uncharacterized protein LOC123302923 n=1 Tax=Chrysoperla carnea TaxID=189513 RepID=UPI001D0789B7|nr:uncharacterized protein LOC123302923 [Chrysoperla carnea]
MGPDMAVEMLLHNEDFVAERVRVDTLIGDDDSSTIARLRRESDHKILKWADVNHATSGLSNVETSRQALLNIIPHAFDDHTNCKEWCGFHKNPEKYEHKLLPGGKGLTGDNLKYSLEKIFRNFANNAEQLAPCGSSQANESMNMKIASKAPKARHYGGSESNDFRVATAPVPKSSIAKDETVAAVFFDLETTGFGQSCEIVQIAAKYNDTEYNVYILPTKGIPPSASAVTGLTTKGGKLFLLGIEVETESAKLAADGLLSFLKSTKQRVILIAHNCIRFDAPIILRLMKQVELLTEFKNTVSGFCDTLPLFKSKLPERKSEKLSLKQSALAEKYLQTDDLKGAHNAINDVSVLQKLVYHAKINITHDELKLNTVTIKIIV